MMNAVHAESHSFYVAGMGEAARTILIVDDEAAIRNALKRVFGKRGWHVSEAADGLVAASLLKDNGPTFYSVILSDLNMPGYDGPELFEKVAREFPETVGRMIFASGDVNDDSARQLAQRTGRPLLEKPFDITELVNLAEQVRGSQAS